MSGTMTTEASSSQIVSSRPFSLSWMCGSGSLLHAQEKWERGRAHGLGWRDRFVGHRSVTRPSVLRLVAGDSLPTTLLAHHAQPLLT